jgi:hypothetical protein
MTTSVEKNGRAMGASRPTPTEIAAILSNLEPTGSVVTVVRERVRCGKPSCRCARGLRHGPYMFLRYQYWDEDAGRDRYAREYVPRSELPRVRRWIRRARAETALGWGQAGFLRRLMASVSRARARNPIASHGQTQWTNCHVSNEAGAGPSEGFQISG